MLKKVLKTGLYLCITFDFKMDKSEKITFRVGLFSMLYLMNFAKNMIFRLDGF